MLSLKPPSFSLILLFFVLKDQKERWDLKNAEDMSLSSEVRNQVSMPKNEELP